ncbi:uncharacterized protein LOC135937097 [Cloeon dipterum]|uniref:uncharacterized protein LOC135937097 n=1 Tax=Cloeon dipterum TaxID=197152 RepID=UPI0032200486
MDKEWSRAVDFPNSRTFIWDDLLGFAGNNIDKRNAIDRQRKRKEHLPGFDKTRIGSLCTVWKETYQDNMLQKLVPHQLTTYKSLNRRARERQDQYVDCHRSSINPLVEVRMLVMQRRSPELPKLENEQQKWLQLAGKSVSKQDQLQALQYIRENFPQVDGALDEYNALQRCMSVPLLEYKWLQTALNAISGACTLTRVEPNVWIAELNLDMNSANYQCLQEAIGIWAHFRLPQGSMRSENDKLLVSNLSATHPTLTLEVGYNNTNIDQSWLTELELHARVECSIRFTSSSIVYQIPLAGTFDALTAMKHLFFPGRGLPPASLGSPLIPRHIIDGLRNGSETPIGGPLNSRQLQAVCDILSHSRLHHVYTLIGPPGTGKTRVLDEVLLQLYSHHMEDYRADALVHFVVNSNKGINATIKRLLRKGL